MLPSDSGAHCLQPRGCHARKTTPEVSARLSPPVMTVPLPLRKLPGPSGPQGKARCNPEEAWAPGLVPAAQSV